MKKRIAFIAVVSAIALAAQIAAGAEQPLRFLHLLQENGYGDVAVDYLEMLAKRPDMPAEIRDVWELEMARSLMAAAADAFDAREKEQLLRESREHLAKFIKEKSNHPAAAMASVAWSEFLVKQSLDQIRQAKPLDKNKEQQEKLLAEARTGLAEAREKLQQAEGKFQTRLGELPPLPKASARKSERDEALAARIEAEANLREAQLQIAMIDYYLAQTYLDSKSEERTEALKKAAAALDAVYQGTRSSPVDSPVYRIALRAHAWHGKTADELGDFQLAMDLYDEVLVNAADPGDKTPATGLEPLYAQVEYFRLLMLAKQKPDQFLADATAWLQSNRRMKRTEGYQGVCLEVAKAELALAETANGPEKARRILDARHLLAEMAKVRSPYQHEALLLRRDLLKAAGNSNLEVTTFDEAVALGSAAAADGQWEQARAAYNKALELAARSRREDPAAVAEVREELTAIQTEMARDLFRKGKFDECLEMARGIVFEDAQRKVVRRESAAAARAAALAVAAALNLYDAAPKDKKPAALEKMTRLAEFTEKNWPDRAEADDARIARGQAKLVVEQVRAAIDVFQRVNPKSARYGVAMCLAGQCYWRLYLTEKAKPEAARDAPQMAADRVKAVERLTAGVAILKRQADAGQPSKAFVAAQLLLARIRFEGGDVAGAAALYQPLVDLVQAEAPQTLDEETLGIFLGAVRAYCAAGDLDRAGRIGERLIEMGPDTPPVNAALVDFARLLNQQRKQAEAQVVELETTTKDAETKRAKERLAAVQAVLGKILVKLAGRKQVSLAGMVFVGETLGAIGMTAEASRQFQTIIEHTETDPEFAKTAEKAMTRVRARLVGVLRKEGKYEEALKQVDLLLKDHSNSLELLMEKGQILQDWSEKEPAHFSAAVDHWVMLRNRLQGQWKKPPEYYDVMYNVAACLVRQAENTKDKATTMDLANKAEKVLNYALIMSPKLNGPDTVARYKVLLDKAITMQGRKVEKKG
jgi:tetratricopeptide (TPR) repeat protein